MSEALLLAAAVAIVLGIAWRVGRLARRRPTVIYPPSVGLEYRDGQFQRLLPPGRHARFDPFGRTHVVEVSTAELPGGSYDVTVLSRDQFSFRLTLTPVAAVTDARLFAESQVVALHGLAPQMLAVGGHPLLQPALAAAALDEAVARPLAEIVATPQPMLEAIAARIADAVPGAEVRRLLLTGLTLPPETRKMFTEVERARIEAQGAVERARGEQAALRVLANAARLLADNPHLASLRLLQAIETSKGPTTIVVGEGSGLTPPRPAGRAERTSA